MQIHLICTKKLCIYAYLRVNLSSSRDLPKPQLFLILMQAQSPSELRELICKELCDPEVSGWGTNCASTLIQSSGLSLIEGQQQGPQDFQDYYLFRQTFHLVIIYSWPDRHLLNEIFCSGQIKIPARFK